MKVKSWIQFVFTILYQTKNVKNASIKTSVDSQIEQSKKLNALALKTMKDNFAKRIHVNLIAKIVGFVNGIIEAKK